MTHAFVTRIAEIPLVRDELVQSLDYAVPIRLYHPKPDEAVTVALAYPGLVHVFLNLEYLVPEPRADIYRGTGDFLPNGTEPTT